MLPLFCVQINPLGRAVSWFGHPVREPGAIYRRCNALEPECGLTAPVGSDPSSRFRPGLIADTVMQVPLAHGAVGWPQGCG